MRKSANSMAILFFVVFTLSIFPAIRAYAAESVAPPTPEQFQKALHEDDIQPEKKKKKETLKERYARISKKLPPIKMILVKGGCFKMGDATDEGDDDERPAHDVCVSDYYIAETDVTMRLFDTVFDFPTLPKDPDRPMTFVSYQEAMKFIATLNAITKGFYRLPTEAEWEYAARNRGKDETWPGVNNEAELGDYAWFADNSGEKVHDVKQKKPNGLGLYDMSGNVWQWTEDNFDFDYYKKSPKQDPFNRAFSQWRTVRGGSIVDNSYKLRTTYRYGLEPATRRANVGFRLAE